MSDTQKSNKRVLRVALFGLGKMGLHHLRIIKSNPFAEIVGVVDPSIGKRELCLDNGKKIPAFSDSKKLLEGLAPEVVHVVTPPQTHCNLGMAALDAGAHVYIEKPFTLRRAEAEALFAIAGEKQLELCAGHQLLYEPPVKIAEKLLPIIGQAVHIESYFSFRPVRRSVTATEQIIDILPHPVYLLLHFLEKCQAANTLDALEIKGVELSRDGEIRVLVPRAKYVPFWS